MQRLTKKQIDCAVRKRFTPAYRKTVNEILWESWWQHPAWEQLCNALQNELPDVESHDLAVVVRRAVKRCFK